MRSWSKVPSFWSFQHGIYESRGKPFFRILYFFDCKLYFARSPKEGFVYICLHQFVETLHGSYVVRKKVFSSIKLRLFSVKTCFYMSKSINSWKYVQKTFVQEVFAYWHQDLILFKLRPFGIFTSFRLQGVSTQYDNLWSPRYLAN